jgi:hypothetical protein
MHRTVSPHWKLVPWWGLACFASILPVIQHVSAAEAGTHLRYLVLTTQHDLPPPFPAVDFLYGPEERIGSAVYRWWQLQARNDTDLNATPLFVLRGLTSSDPLQERRKRLDLNREMLVGTGRNFKDAEGRRLPQIPVRRNYTYVRFTPEC